MEKSTTNRKTKKLITIGLIGGVASGKSAVAAILEKLGAKVLDADRLGHRVLEKREVQDELVRRWGEIILTSESTPKKLIIDRSEIAKIVFGENDQSKEELCWLESISHPIIGQMMEQEIQIWKQNPNLKAILLDAPVLIKAGWDRFCDEILFVDCPASVRWQRASERGWTQTQWEDRENQQTPLEIKKAKATFILNNEVDLKDVQIELEKYWDLRVLSNSES